MTEWGIVVRQRANGWDVWLDEPGATPEDPPCQDALIIGYGQTRRAALEHAFAELQAHQAAIVTALLERDGEGR